MATPNEIDTFVEAQAHRLEVGPLAELVDAYVKHREELILGLAITKYRRGDLADHDARAAIAAIAELRLLIADLANDSRKTISTLEAATGGRKDRHDEA